MTWDATTPQGSEAVSLGDDRIRELKSDLEDALTIEHAFPIDTSAPGLIYTPSRGNTASRPTGTYLVTGRLYINTQTGCIERYNGATWDEVNTQPIDASITADHLATSVAGDGLAGGGGTALSVNVDGSTIEINADTLRVKDLGITTAKIAAAAVDENKLAASVAGSGLAGGAGSALSVNVDSSTIEINADTLRVKDGGITYAKLNADVTSKLSPKSIQVVTKDCSVNLATTSFPQTFSTTITSVDTSKAYVIMNGFYHSSGTPSNPPQTTEASCKLTSATNVDVTVNMEGSLGAAATIVIRVIFTVVEWN